MWRTQEVFERGGTVPCVPCVSRSRLPEDFSLTFCFNRPIFSGFDPISTGSSAVLFLPS